MSKTAVIAVLCVTVFQCLIIIIGNGFTIFVFCIHRKRLKRTSIVLINLAVADLLVGFSDLLDSTASDLPKKLGQVNVNQEIHHFILNSLPLAFSVTSILFLVLISLERAFALIQPLRHRTTRIKAYIYSVFIVWLAGIAINASRLVLDFLYYAALSVIIFTLSLVSICASYLAIRLKRNNKCPVVNSAHNRKSAEQNKKLSKTLFIMVGASLLFWLPSLVLYSVNYFYQEILNYVSRQIVLMLHMTNSLVNPIIYSFRMPVFRETLKRMKAKLRIKTNSKKYTVNDRTCEIYKGKECTIGN